MDPVYEEFILIERGSPVERVLRSSPLQRLRYIRQLGPCYLIYPGAEHTRFQHSLGVYWLVEKTFNYLRMNGYAFSEDVELPVKLAALTHDLGHSPFSHALEGYILPVKHEELTLKALEKVESEIGIEKELLEETKKILRKEHNQPFTYQLVSSQLDCDRLDYLRRDAFYTGVSFGRIDTNRILVSARVENGELVWSSKGFNALESYVMSRYQMYWTVYFHKVNLSAQVLLQKIVRRMRELLLSGEELPIDKSLKKCLKDGSPEEFFNLTDGHIICSIYALQNHKDAVISDLSRRFVRRELFRTVEVKPADLLELKEKVEKAGFSPDYYFEVIEPSKVAYSYYSPKGTEVIKVKVGEKIEELSNVAPTDAIKALSREVSKTYAVVPSEVLQ